MTISEYDGPPAWADMTAVEKMEAWLCGDVAECDEREVFKQAIREAASDHAAMTAMAEANRALQAEVARHVANLAECYRIAGADPDGNTDAMLAQDAVRAVMDLRRDYDQACEDDHRLRAEVARLRAALVEVMEYEGGSESPLEDQYLVDRIRAALEPTR